MDNGANNLLTYSSSHMTSNPTFPGPDMDVTGVFELFGQSARAGSLVVDAARQQVRFSAGAARLHGLEPVGQVLPLADWIASLDTESRETVLGLLGQPFSRVSQGIAELECRLPDAGCRRFHLMTAPHPQQEGAVMALCFEQGCCREARAREEALEQQIREGDAFWPRVIDELRIGLWSWDIRTNEVFRTRDWNSRLGIDAGEQTAIVDWEERLHPDDREACASALKDYFDNRLPLFECEYRIRGEDGRFHWVSDRGKIIEWDESGEPARMCGVVVDISRQKALQESLDARESQFRAVFNSLFNFVGLLNTDGSIMECNQAVYDVTGLPRDFMKGVPIWEGAWWVATETRKALPGWVRRAAGGEIVREEVEIAGMDGRVLRVDFSIKPVRLGESGEIRWLVTEGRVLESSLPAVNAAVAGILQPPPVTSESPCVAMIFPDGRFMSASRPFRSLIGFTEVELMGMGYRDITHPEDVPAETGFRQALLDGDCDSYTLETRFMGRNGEEVPVEIDVSMVRNTSGNALYFTMRVRDLRPAWHEQTLRRIS